MIHTSLDPNMTTEQACAKLIPFTHPDQGCCIRSQAHAIIAHVIAERDRLQAEVDRLEGALLMENCGGSA